MDTTEIINSGNLELYVYGLLNESDTKQIADLSKTDAAIKNEILSIEKSIINLSSSFAPHISAEVYEKVKAKLELKHSKVVVMKPSSNRMQYLGWAASLILLLGVGFQYFKMNEKTTQLNSIELEKSNLEKSIGVLEQKSKETENTLSIIRDAKNTVVALGGQAIDPTASAKVYWNKEKQTVYVDASGLPEAPEGMVYQVWALKLNPLTPTSIGLLENFNSDNTKVFAVNGTNDAEAFGITLEPAGGSKSPTLEKLYTLGKV